MGPIGPSGKARRAARCGASGKRRNDAGGPIFASRILLYRFHIREICRSAALCKRFKSR